MSIDEFMKMNIIAINDIISEKLKSEFNSHEFIEKFSKEFEPDYIKFLCNYCKRGAFQTVHSQIAIFLSDNSTKLNIEKTKQVESLNIFGDIDKIQGWKKTK